MIAKLGNKPTFVRAVLDLALFTANCRDYINSWHVLEGPSCSDHRYILCELSALAFLMNSDRNPRTTNWERYVESPRKALEDGLALIKEIGHIDRAIIQVN